MWLFKVVRRLGPSFVYILTALGAGDLVTNAAAGAGYGYALIWTLAFTLLFRFVWVSVSAKYVLVTGKSLAQGYAKVGRWVVWIILISGIIIGHFSAMYSLLMSGTVANELLPLPTEWGTQIWALAFVLIAFVMAYWGGYGVVEKFCKVLIAVMGVSLIVAAIISRPDPTEILRGMLIPSIPQSDGLYSSMLILMALVGTMAGSLTNLTYAYYIDEKGWKNTSHLKEQRFDLIFGVVCLFLMGALLQIASAATARPLGIELEGARDLLQIFAEVQGTIGLIIFGLGLWGAAFSTLLGTLIGYGFVVADLSNFVSKKAVIEDTYKKDKRKHPVYRACVIFWSISPLYILLTGVSPIWLVLIVNAMFVVLVPVLTPALLKLTNDKSLMGKYKNNWATNMTLLLMLFVAIFVMLIEMGVDDYRVVSGFATTGVILTAAWIRNP